MNNDIKSGVGYIIPLGAIVGFFTALFLGEYQFSIYIAIAGILVWFLYMVIMESSPPSNLGNLIIFFGVLLSIGVFMGFGVTQNMWGGIEFVSEGFLFALVILFFSILTVFGIRKICVLFFNKDVGNISFLILECSMYRNNLNSRRVLIFDADEKLMI